MKVEKFICDECKAESPDNKEGEIQEAFPYNKRWIFVFELNGKVEGAKIIEKKNLHFCSKKCMLKYIDNTFTKKEN